MESILETIKIMLGEESTHFDVEITVLINTAFMKLMQLGVGPSAGFSIENETDKWNDFIPLEDFKYFLAVKNYVYMDVRLVFDPPTPQYVLQAMKEAQKEIEWRLTTQVEINKEEVI